MINLTQQAADLFGIELSVEQSAAFDTYVTELIAWNNKINLTAIIKPDEVRVRHFLDSFSITRAVSFESSLRIIDVGTGAGFPGLALAILFPHVHVTLLESTRKKIVFLDHVIEILKLSNTQTVHSRAEDAGQNPAHREKYDLVLARAVARLPSLLEYMLPLAQVGGYCIAMKGKTAQVEVDDSITALQTLGGEFKKIETIQLPGVESEHHLVIVEKVSRTSRMYPRQAGMPTRQPLA